MTRWSSPNRPPHPWEPWVALALFIVLWALFLWAVLGS